MKTIKRSIAVLLAAALLAVLAGCGGSGTPGSEPAESTAEPIVEPTEVPTPEPTEEPTEVPTPEPTEEPVDEFVETKFDEPLVTTDPVTLSSGSRSVTFSLPSEYETYERFDQRYSSIVNLKSSDGRTQVGFTDKTSAADYIDSSLTSIENVYEGLKDALNATDFEKEELVTAEMNGFQVTWTKATYLSVASNGREVVSTYYVAAANIGTYVFTVDIEFSHRVDRECPVDDNIIPTIFSHITDLG